MKITNKYVFFYKENLSQFFKTDIIDKDMNKTFSCAEQGMMYYKAILFNDFESAEKIMQCVLPRDMQTFGRKVKNYDQDIWNNNKYEIVWNINWMKFTQNFELMKSLLSYGNRTFVEASPIDGVWGIKMNESDFGIEEEKNWKGENLLGCALTEVRDRLNHQLYNHNNLYEFPVKE